MFLDPVSIPFLKPWFDDEIYSPSKLLDLALCSLIASWSKNEVYYVLMCVLMVLL
jgi:hypothetical protein